MSVGDDVENRYGDGGSMWWKRSARKQRRPSLFEIRETELAELREANGSRTYGWNGTIHHSEEVDIQIGPDGKVIAVWFRCQMLPFSVSHVELNRSTPNNELPRIMAVEVIDR